MNFEQIKKLIRPANNNPNDNEANLAAREVCRRLASYEFVVSKPPEPPKTTHTHRAEDPFWDAIFKAARERNAKREQNYKSAPSYQEYIKYDPLRKAAEKNTRLCSKCGKWKETIRVTNIFTCNECEWNAFNERNNTSSTKT